VGRVEAKRCEKLRCPADALAKRGKLAAKTALKPCTQFSLELARRKFARFSTTTRQLEQEHGGGTRARDERLFAPPANRAERGE